MASAAIEREAPRYPPARAGWSLVALLTLAYVFSFIDRYILGLLIEPIKADLGMTDAQIGWVLGPAFAIFYATMGLPLGWLVDRKRRTLIVAAGIFVWSFATAISGLARSFLHLFLARMAVGVGEATLSPAAMSMISDSFPPERRSKPIAVYVAALSLGAGIASLIGSAVLTWAKTAGTIEVPLVGPVLPWQLTFFIVGLPGIALAAIFLFVREPVRRRASEDEARAGVTGNGIGDALSYVRRNAGVYGGFISLACVMAIVAYGQSFLAPVFERTHGWPPEKYAFVNAIVLLSAGPGSVFLSGVISDRMAQAGRKDAPIHMLVAGYIAMLPTAIIPMFVASPELAFVFLFFNTAAVGVVSAMAVTALLAITPSAIRGQLTAFYYMSISMTGLFLGPPTVGYLSTHVFGEADLRYAYAATCAIYALVPTLFIGPTLRAYRRQLARVA
ncbi:MFS transporter [Erythrobacter sp.]|jgi:MFS family permease|uniref:MFS transporter n=1 Tax=Erythrobacter sp. TaxID=1042 RepID=UPI002EC72A7B|nr:MFS transporter [Erythrobacter sp.]